MARLTHMEIEMNSRGGIILANYHFTLNIDCNRPLIASSGEAPLPRKGAAFSHQSGLTSLVADLPLVITIEEFAERMQVGETTVWKWIRAGKIRPGRHFIQIDRIIRFHWCNDLIHRLLEDCGSGELEAAEIIEDAPAPQKKHRRKRGECPINIDY